MLNLISEEGLPNEIVIIPPPEKDTNQIKGVDGRVFINESNRDIIQKFKQNGLDIPIDINHATETRAHHGEASPAIGWIKELFERDSTLFGRVEWNTGAETVKDKEYRYLSPSFLCEYSFSKEGTKCYIRGISSVAVCNTPNLRDIPALNTESSKGENRMKKIIKALNLKEGASEEEVLSAIESRRQGMVPKSDYDLVLNRAEQAEEKLAEEKTKEFKKELNAALDEAIKNRKIAPASRKYHEGTIRTEAQLNSFKEMVGASPEIIQKEEQKTESAPELNAQEAEWAEKMGYSPKEWTQIKGEK